jgi:hypothetical protein
MREIAALIQSIVRQTFSWYGPEYLRYMVKALWKRPFQVVHVVTMSVLGHHFMTITRKSLWAGRVAGASSARRFREVLDKLARAQRSGAAVFDNAGADGTIAVGSVSDS